MFCHKWYSFSKMVTGTGGRQYMSGHLDICSINSWYQGTIVIGLLTISSNHLFSLNLTLYLSQYPLIFEVILSSFLE